MSNVNPFRLRMDIYRSAVARFTVEPYPFKRRCSMIIKQITHGRNILIIFVALIVFVLLISHSSPASAQGGKEPARQVKGQRQGLPGLEVSVRASRIIDRVANNTRGEELGEVDDLIVSRNGRTKKVILSVGWYLGVGDKLVALPFRSLRMNEEGSIMYDVSKGQLEASPAFAYLQEGLLDYYYSPPPPYGSPGLRQPPGHRMNPMYGGPYGPIPPPGTYQWEYGTWKWGYFPERLRLSAILNRAALNKKGEEVGQIDDLIINPQGRIVQIVLSVGRIIGVQEKLVALPFKELEVTNLGFIYDVSKEELKERPPFRYED
jgi:sporulation protein YlmC with PRC-barrel domain